MQPASPIFFGGVTYLADVASLEGGCSTRLLRSDYTGSCMRVRRSSDSSEQDIGFVNGVLDEASLLTFVGAGDGDIVTWYDQIGSNNLNLTSEAKIVSSGVVNKASGFPAAYSSTDLGMETTSNTANVGSIDYFISIVHQVNDINKTQALFADGAGSANQAFGGSLQAVDRLFYWANDLDATLSGITDLAVKTYSHVSGSRYIHENGVQRATQSSVTKNTALSKLNLGRGFLSTTHNLQGHVAEIVWGDGLSVAQFTNVSANQTNYYT